MTLHSWGANSYGQLGQNHIEDKLCPSPVQDPKTKFSVVTGGGGHSLGVTEGVLFSCGSNEKGQLGLGHKKNKTTLECVSSLSNTKVTKAAGGWDFSLATCENGSIYSWGSNAFGQLGSKDIVGRDKPEQIISTQTTFKDVACGLRHSVFLTDQGDILCCGSGRKGQLGCSFTDKLPAKCPEPVTVALPNSCSKTVNVTAGAYHSAALTDKGQVVIWGDNKHGQCCIDPEQKKIVMQPYIIPQELFHNRPVSQLHSGWTHLLAKTADGSVYSWGRNDYGQLGRPCSKKESTFDPLPRTITSIQNPKQLVCGSEHNLALLENGALLTWGWNEHGMCATGGEENVLSPLQISSFSHQTVELIGSGHGHSFAVVSQSESELS